MGDALLNQSVLTPSPFTATTPIDVLQSRHLINLQTTANNMLSTVMEGDNPYIRDPYQYRCHEDYEGWKRTQEGKNSPFVSPITSLSYRDQSFMENFMRMKYEKWAEKYETARRDVEVQFQKRKQTSEMVRHAWKSTLDLFVAGHQSSEKTFRDILSAIQQQVALDVVVSPAKETIMEALQSEYTHVLYKKDPVYFPEWGSESFRFLKEAVFASMEAGFRYLAPTLSAHHPEICSIKIKTLARYASMILTTQEENLRRMNASKYKADESKGGSLICMAEDYVPAHLRYPFSDRVSIESEEPPEDFHFSEIEKTKRSAELEKMEMSYSEAMSADASSSSLGVQVDEDRNRAAWKEWKTYFRPNRVRIFLDYREMDILEMIEGIIPGVQTFSIYPGDCHFVVGGTLFRMAEIKKKTDLTSNYKHWTTEEPRFNNHPLPASLKEMWLVDMNSPNTMTLETTVMTQSIASHLQQRNRWHVKFMDNHLTMMVRLYADICSYVRVPMPLYRELQNKYLDLSMMSNELKDLYTKSTKGNSTHTQTMSRTSDNFSNAKYVFSLHLRTLIPGFPEAACDFFWAYFGTWTNMMRVLSGWSVEKRITVLNNFYQIGHKLACVMSETFCPLKDLAALNECRERPMNEEETLRMEIIQCMPRKKTYREDKFFPPATGADAPTAPATTKATLYDSDNDLLFPSTPLSTPATKKEKTRGKKREPSALHPSVVFHRYPLPSPQKNSHLHILEESIDTQWEPDTSSSSSLKRQRSERSTDSIEDFPFMNDPDPPPSLPSTKSKTQRAPVKRKRIRKKSEEDEEENEEEEDPEAEWFPQEDEEVTSTKTKKRTAKKKSKSSQEPKRQKSTPKASSSSSSVSNTLLFDSQYNALLKKMQSLPDDD